ncbi:Peptidyl-prolyl cis-trans isomerase pin1 [Zancudomyces culisetae]|uniref:peptidylprolyl isomerase n=1 Tax=Zancudomyces culisetae TaxID=1213189 RepID=A0A1R1PYA3_ZANCU|nr:Peptidyl-prolyl cis-trans isomerase pin1 [Zancudomyces culisetae]|eukprot:OMH85932.1 Peptidyl-prolyl cis-trans isomerase pin1 [Zancudomyces culisetae]
MSKSRNMPYYFNPLTKESRWDPPTGSDAINSSHKYSAHTNSNSGKVRVSHILVKHRDSRRPSSWRQETITRSKDEALEIINDYRKQIEGGEVTFEEIAKNYSDCTSAKRGGDLGYFGRGQMQPAFEEASFSLSDGELRLFSLLKVGGKEVKQEVIEDLIENRIVLEKIRPIEQKLRYQMDRLIRAAINKEEEHGERKTQEEKIKANPNAPSEEDDDDDEKNELNYKPKLGNLVSSSTKDTGKVARPGREDVEKGKYYQPPKLIPTKYEEQKGKKQRHKEVSSRVISELLEDEYYSKLPETTTSAGTANTIGVATSAKAEHHRKELVNYEEDYLIRMTVNKKDKKMLKQGYKRLDDEFKDLNSDFVALRGENRLDQAYSQYKKRKHDPIASRTDFLKSPRKSKSSKLSLDNPSKKALKKSKFSVRAKK